MKSGKIAWTLAYLLVANGAYTDVTTQTHTWTGATDSNWSTNSGSANWDVQITNDRENIDHNIIFPNVSNSYVSNYDYHGDINIISLNITPSSSAYTISGTPNSSDPSDPDTINRFIPLPAAVTYQAGNNPVNIKYFTLPQGSTTITSSIPGDTNSTSIISTLDTINPYQTSADITLTSSVNSQFGLSNIANLKYLNLEGTTVRVGGDSFTLPNTSTQRNDTGIYLNSGTIYATDDQAILNDLFVSGTSTLLSEGETHYSGIITGDKNGTLNLRAGPSGKNSITNITLLTDFTVDGKISGIEPLEINAQASTLTITNENSTGPSDDSDYSGDTSIVSGTVVIQANNALGGGKVKIDPQAYIHFGGNDYTLPNDIVSSDPTGTININTDYESTLSGPIGALGKENTFYKGGSGTLKLTHLNALNACTEVEISKGKLTIPSFPAASVHLSDGCTLVVDTGVETTGNLAIYDDASATLQTGSGITTIKGTVKGSASASLNLIGQNSLSTIICDGNGLENDTFTINGSITGSQTLIKEGVATIVLAGSNKASSNGGLEIKKGTIKVNGADNLPGGTIAFSGDDDKTLHIVAGGNIDNPLLIQGSSPTLRCDQNTTFKGMITGSNKNQLVLESDKVISIEQIEVKDNEEFSVEGILGGPTSLTKSGGGVLTFPVDVNTYSGGTNLLSGKIKVVTDKQLGSGPIALHDGTALLNNGPNNTNVNFNNAFELMGSNQTIQGSFSIYNSIVGSGNTLNLLGIDDQISHFTLGGQGGGESSVGPSSSGALVVKNSIVSIHNPWTLDTITADSRSTLTLGLGPIKGNTTIQGLYCSGQSTAADGPVNPTVQVSLGNRARPAKARPLHLHSHPPRVIDYCKGTTELTGNFVLEDGSGFVTSVDPTGPTLLNVDGTVTIGNNVTFYLIPNEHRPGYLTGSHYDIIVTTGGVTGTFANIESLLSDLVTGSLNYDDPNKVVLTLKSASLSSVFKTGNKGRVAKAMSLIAPTNNGGVAKILESVSSLSENELANAVEQLHPALLKSATVAQQNNGVSIREALSQQIQMGFDKRTCNTSNNRQKNKVREQGSRKEIQFWSAAVGDYTQQKGTFFIDSPQLSYHLTTGGLVTGLGLEVKPGVSAGVIGAYTHTDIKWLKNHGNAAINSGYAGFYGSAVSSFLYGNFSMIGAYSNFDEQRTIIYGDVNRKAKNSHGGLQLVTHADAGFKFNYKNFTIRPFDSIDWIIQSENKFTEKGADEYNLSISKTHGDMVRNELGLNFAGCQVIRSVKSTFDTKIGWIREVRMSGMGTDSKFVGTDVSFMSIGLFPTRNLFSIGASVSGSVYKDRLNCTLYYNGSFGLHHRNNGIGGQVNFGF